MMSFENSPPPRTDTKYLVKWLCFLGGAAWWLILLLQFWHLYNAQTFAQASLFSGRIISISGFGILLSMLGARWQRRRHFQA
jgi:hypothetical protein